MAHETSVSLDDLMDSLCEVEDDDLPFKDSLSQSKEKFERRAKQVHNNINELLMFMDDKSGNLSYEKKSDDTEQVFEAKLHKIEGARKKDHQRAQKLFEEVQKLEKQNADLENKLNELQGDTTTEKGDEYDDIEVLSCEYEAVDAASAKLNEVPIKLSHATDVSHQESKCLTTQDQYDSTKDEVVESRVVCGTCSVQSDVKKQHLQLSNVMIETVAPQKVKERCFSLFYFMLLFILKFSAVLLSISLLILSLFIALVSANSALNRCGGKPCSQSFLLMLLGQNLIYMHEGDVPL